MPIETGKFVPDELREEKGPTELQRDHSRETREMLEGFESQLEKRK